MRYTKWILPLILMIFVSACHDSNSNHSTTGGVTPAPDGGTLTASPAELALVPGQNATVTLTNVSQTSTTVTVAVSSGSLPNLVISPDTCNNLAAGASCTINVSSAAGVPDQQGELTASSSAGASIEIPVTVETPSLSASGTNISTVGNNTITLSNNGINPVTFDHILLNAGSSNLSLSNADACGTSLAPGNSCALNIVATSNSQGLASIAFEGGNYADHLINLNVIEPSIQFLSGSGPEVAENFYIDSGASQSINIKNTGPFAVQNLNVSLFNAPSSLSVTNNSCLTTLAPDATCSITIHAESASTANADTAIVAMGDNLPPVSLPLTTGNNVVVTAIAPDTQASAARGLSLLELQVQNHLPGAIQSISVSSVSASESNQLTVIANALHPNTCTGSLDSNANCTVWVQALSGTDLGLANQQLQLNYQYQAHPAVEPIHFIVSTNLYLAGHFQLSGTTPCYTGIDGNGQPIGVGDCDNFVRFDGGHWYQAGNAVLSAYTGTLADAAVRDMQLGPDGRLYLAGGFSAMNMGGEGAQSCASYVAAWDGVAWDNLGVNSGENPANCSVNDSLIAGPASNSSFYKPIGIAKYAHVNMLAFDARDETLFFNNVTSLVNGDALIYRHALNQAGWPVIAQNQSNSAISDAMLYDANNDRLYLSGGTNTSQGSERPLLWYANAPATSSSISWTAFNPFANPAVNQNSNSMIQNGNTLYSYYSTVSGSTVIDYIARCTLPLETGSCSTTALSSPLGRVSLIGLDPSNSNLISIGHTQASLPLTSSINLASNWTEVQRTDRAGGVSSQIVSNEVNVGQNQYFVGTFNNLYNTNVACIIKVNNGTGVAVSGFNSSSCVGNFNPAANAIFGEVVVPTVILTTTSAK